MALIGISLCLGLSLFYVSSLYVWDIKLPRDDPSVIKRRTISVLFSTVVCIFATQKYTNMPFQIPPIRWDHVFSTTGQILILMAGPLVRTVFAGRNFASLTSGWVFLRNLIVAPVSEEIVFRACFLQILTASGFSSRIAAVIAPFLFALAHVHHNWNEASFAMVFMSVAHTCVFGWIAFYFLINKSVWDSIVAHVVCNAIGLPPIQSRVQLITYIAGLVTFIVSL